MGQSPVWGACCHQSRSDPARLPSVCHLHDSALRCSHRSRFYYDPILDRHIGAVDPDYPGRARKFLFARDPRNVSVIYFMDPDVGNYVAIPYRNIGLPAVSSGEVREAKSAFDRKDGTLLTRSGSSRVLRPIASCWMNLLPRARLPRQSAKRPKEKLDRDAVVTHPQPVRQALETLNRDIFSQQLEVLEIGDFS